MLDFRLLLLISESRFWFKDYSVLDQKFKVWSNLYFMRLIFILFLISLFAACKMNKVMGW